MSKKVSQSDLSDFLSKVLATIPEDQRGTVESALKSDSFAEAASPFIMMRSDYSREQDRLAKEKADLEAEKNRYTEWYGVASAEAAAAAEVKAEAEKRIAAYEATYGPLDDADKKRMAKIDPAQLESALLDKLQKEIANRDFASLKVNSMLTDMQWEHREKFNGERLDTDALLKFAGEKQLPLDAAYREFVAPKVQELDKADREKAIQKAREEGAAEALSKHRLPVSPAAAGPNIFSLSKDSQPLSEFERQLAFRDLSVANTK